VARFRTAKITPRAIDALKPGETIRDTKLDGFFVRCQVGAKVYFVRKHAHGQRHFLTIGKHGREWTPSRARQEALLIVAALRKRYDPAVERARIKGMPTVADWATEILAENPAGLKPGTLANYRGIFQNYVGPSLGRFKLDQLSTADVDRLHRHLRKTPRAANHVIDFLGSLYKQARLQRIVSKDVNPCADLKRLPIRKRERFLSSDELVRLGAVLSSPQVGKTESPHALAAIRLLLLTGCRRDEVLSLRWEQVDFDRDLLLLPDSKTGQRPVYLSAPAKEVLSAIPRVQGNPFVIVGERDGSHWVNLQKPWRRIRQAAGLDGVRIHDLRHSYASMAATGGAPLLYIGKLLGHTQAQTTASYAHLANDPVKQVNEEVGRRIAAAMGGQAAEVIPLRSETRVAVSKG
jgi:integrase